MLLQSIEAVAAKGVRLGGRAALVTWIGNGAGSTARPTLDGLPLPRPFATLSLDAPGGAPGAGRCATLLRLPVEQRRRASIGLAPGVSLPLSALDTDFASLDALGPPARARLLRFLLEFARGPLGLAADPALARLCEVLASPAGTARPVATLGARLLVQFDAAVPPGTAAYLCGPGGVRRGPVAPTPGGLLLLDRPRGPEALVLAGPDAATRWTIERTAVRPALAAMAADPALRRRLPAALAPLADVPAVTALLRECALLPAAPVRRQRGSALDAVLELAVPDGAGGAFLQGWTRDPLQLVSGASLLSGSGEIPIPPDALFRFAPTPVAAGRSRDGKAAGAPPPGARGFVTHLPDARCCPGILPGLRLRLGSGASLDLSAPTASFSAAAARDAVLASVPVPEASARMLDQCLRPAAGRLHAAALGRRVAPELVRIGAPVRSPLVSVVVPLYRNLGFQRFQVAALASDTAMRGVELIFVLDSPEQRAEAEHLLRGLHAMHGIPMLLAVMPSNMGYAPANNDAARHARGRYLLLLNSDVVPAAPGWLPRLLAPLEADRTIGAAGPKLLFEDGSIQHAGLFFECDPSDGIWLNRHFHKGYPRLHAPANRARAVPGVTGAALLVRRKLFEAVGGFTEEFIVGDYEDSDLCLKLRARGAGIAYVPAAELFHFERRSIRLHPGYSRTLASSCNRRLHHEKWDGAIAALMRARRWR